MADELLSYYEKELAFIRQMGAEFARENPKIASRLGINADTIEDPHVSRLVESFAYLNARIQHKLDDDFPEISDALLTVLFPHYQRPIPSMSIVQFTADDEQLDAAYTVPRHTLLETRSFSGESCRFSTAYDVELLPLQVSDATLMGRPFSTPGSDRVRGAASVLKLTFNAFVDSIDLSELATEHLRFYLKGQAQHIHPLYELLFNSCQNVVLSTGKPGEPPIFLGSDALKPVGFEPDQGLLPYPSSSFMGYRLLTEYFAFPQKFMFMDVDGIELAKLGADLNHFELYIYLGESNIELEHNINAENFLLGCSPVVNLFSHDTDPIELDHRQPEYQVVPDVRRPDGYEIYSVDKVMAADAYGRTTTYRPFYGLNHDRDYHSDQAFWYARRQHAKLKATKRDEGTDIFISLVDMDFSPSIAEDKTLLIGTTCSNRDQPSKLPFNQSEPSLQAVNATPPCSAIRCIVQPTETIRPPLGNGARWRLLSHLNLNHWSLTGGESAKEAFKEMLRLYDFQHSSVNRSIVESIVDLQARPVNAPINVGGYPTLCRGIEVTVTINDRVLSGISLCLFSSVIEHFFALYCSVNSFSKVLIKLDNKEGIYKECPIRTGAQAAQ